MFFLDFADARAALKDGQDRRPGVITSRAQRAWIDTHPGSASYGTPPGPPPALDHLPPEVELAMHALQWHAGHVFGFYQGVRSTSSPALITSGIAASPGSYTEPARVVLNETEFHKIRPGDVLVCPATSPIWSVVFPQLGALVTDSGGLLSHPAIIAREYGIPAVVATGNATPNRPTSTASATQNAPMHPDPTVARNKGEHMSTTSEPMILRPGEGRRFPIARPAITVKTDADTSPVALFESEPPPGVPTAPPHVHYDYTEAFYVLAGEIEFRVAERTVRGTAGAFVHVPPGVVHGFHNPGPGRPSYPFWSTPPWDSVSSRTCLH